MHLSIVIVSWNVAEFLDQCLKSIAKNQSGISLEVIVVDNASSDHTRQMLTERFPEVNVIANDTNEGFARANNQALKCISGQLVLFLNPDTIVVDGCLHTMIRFMADHPEVGMAGPRHSYPNGQVRKPCARLMPTLASVVLHAHLRLGKLPLVGDWVSRTRQYPYDYDVSQEVEAISGAAMLVRREVIEAIGGFGDSFIHYGEDLDFCFRVRKAGWKIHYLCDAAVIHFSKQSSRQAPVRIAVNGALSVQQYLIRCFGPGHGLLYRCIVSVLQVPIIIIGCVRLLSGWESFQEFRRRLAIARGIWLWREVKS